MSSSKEKVKLSYVRDLGCSISTFKVYNSAISLFNHFLVNVINEPELEDFKIEHLDADVEDILWGYCSMWLRDTNIPKNHVQARNEKKETTSYMNYTGLNEYLSKTIIALKELLPDHPFLNDKRELDLISGDKFEKACKRSQMNKSDTFGVESKVGLYRVARHGKDTKGTPHWTCLINCDEICKNLMDRTKTDDTTFSRRESPSPSLITY